MAITQITKMSDIEEYIQQQIRKYEESFINTLIYVGKQCVNEAKNNPGYTDQTGNLRSSIGFMVLKEGKVLHQGGFKQEGKGSEGVSEGEEFIKTLIAKNSHGLVLLLVAGMNYAARVENELSRNVIMSGELLAEQLIPQMMKELGFIVR